MLILLHGPDTFRSRRKLKKMIEEFKAKRDPAGLNVAVFDAAKASAQDILEEVAAFPFLAEKRLVVIERLLAGRDKALTDSLFELVKNKKNPETTVMVFWEGDELKGNVHPLAAFLAKQEFSQKFDFLKGEKLGQWIKKELAVSGFKIEAMVLAELINYPWVDLWQLHNELEKTMALTAASGKETVAREDIKLFLNEALDENIFHFLDALAARRAKEAINLLWGQWESGEEEGKIFNLLVGQWRNLLKMKDYFVLNPGVISSQAAAALGIHPFVVKKSLAVLAGFSFEKLKEIYQELLKIDIKAKTGGGDLRNLIEMLVAKICG